MSIREKQTAGDERPRAGKSLATIVSWKQRAEKRYGHAAYFVQFGLVGASGMVVDLAALTVLLMWLPYPLARALAIWIAMSWNFAGNRNVTFSYARGRAITPQYLGYCASCLLGAAANWSTSVSLATYNSFFQSHPLLAALVGVAAGMLFNYVLCRRYVFPKRD